MKNKRTKLFLASTLLLAGITSLSSCNGKEQGEPSAVSIVSLSTTPSVMSSAVKEDANKATYLFTGIRAEEVTGSGSISSGEEVISNISIATGNISPLSATNLSKVYAGFSATYSGTAYTNPNVLKLGTNSAKGIITFNFEDTVSISKVTAKLTGKATTTVLSINGISNQVGVAMSQTAEPNVVEYELVDKSNVLNFETDGTGYVCVYELTIDYDLIVAQ